MVPWNERSSNGADEVLFEEILEFLQMDVSLKAFFSIALHYLPCFSTVVGRTKAYLCNASLWLPTLCVRPLFRFRKLLLLEWNERNKCGTAAVIFLCETPKN